MTDLEIITRMLDRAGITWELDQTDVGLDLTVAQGAGPLNDGYFGFRTTFSFDPRQTLVSMGAWE